MYFISSNTHNQGAGWVPGLPWGGGGLSGEVGGWRGEKKFWRSYIVSNILYPISNILYSVFWSKLTSLMLRWWRRSWGRGRSRWEPEMGNSAAWPAGARNRFNLFCYVLENMKNGHVHRMFQKCFSSGRSCWGVWYCFDQQGSSDLQYPPKDSTYLQKLCSMFCEDNQSSLFFVTSLFHQVQELGRRWSQLQNSLMRLQVTRIVTLLYKSYLFVLHGHQTRHKWQNWLISSTFFCLHRIVLKEEGVLADQGNWRPG